MYIGYNILYHYISHHQPTESVNSVVFTQRLNSKQKNHEQHQQQNCCKVENPRRGEERKGNEKRGERSTMKETYETE